MFLYNALKIEWRNRVSNKSIGSNRRIRVVVNQRHDFTDLQSLENGNFIGWWYIEHSSHYSSQKFWIHKCRSFWWERPFISCRCPKGMVVCQIWSIVFRFNLIFAWTALSGFRLIETLILAWVTCNLSELFHIYIFCPLFLPGPPFRFFDPPGSAFLPRPPFRVFDLPRCSFHISRQSISWLYRHSQGLEVPHHPCV